MQDCNTEEFHVDVTGGQVFARRWIPQTLIKEVPVALLHDSLGCVRMWREFPELLAIRLKRPVIAYDRLGFGKSSALTSPPSLSFIEEEAQIVFPKLCRSLDLEKVILFGHSVGGGMAITIASHHSQTGLCTTVISESAQAFVENRTIEGIQAAKKLFNQPTQLSKLSKYHGSKAQWVLDAWTEVWLDPEFKSWSLDTHLKNIKCPVIAIHGDRDEYGSCEFPHRISDRVEAYSEARILENFGHVPHRENPETILNIVSKFLSKVESKCDVLAGA